MKFSTVLGFVIPGFGIGGEYSVKRQISPIWVLQIGGFWGNWLSGRGFLGIPRVSGGGVGG